MGSEEIRAGVAPPPDCTDMSPNYGIATRRYFKLSSLESNHLSNLGPRMLNTSQVQDYGDANTTVKHYRGYPDHRLPCEKDVGICQHHDAVYWMHSGSMLYTGILWSVNLGILLVWMAVRVLNSRSASVRFTPILDRFRDFVGRFRRRWLLQDAPFRWISGRIARLQVLTLVCMLGQMLFCVVQSGEYIVARDWYRRASISTSLTASLVACLYSGLRHTMRWSIVEGRLHRPRQERTEELVAEQSIMLGVTTTFFMTIRRSSALRPSYPGRTRSSSGRRI